MRCLRFLRLAKILFSTQRFGVLRAIGLIALLASAAAAAPASGFYPGVSEYQSLRAHEALRAYYNGNMARADRILRDLDLHEDAEKLPPLSRLLLTAMVGLTLQRDDAADAADEARLRALLDSAAEKGLRRCAPRYGRPPESTCLLIEGGIRGLRAILKLNTHPPTEVLGEGLDAVALMEKALERDSSLRDAHMGLGIFNAIAASNTPRVVRGMLRAAGRGVSLDEGLAHLRRSGYEGQYTSVASQFYLIRFLSPYDDELRREKTEIFRSLRETFPLSSHTLFLQGHEALSFYPDSFYAGRARVTLARQIRAVEARDYAAMRYVNLVKYQYSLLDPDAPPRYRPDTTFDLGAWAFYPEFIETLRLRREILEADRAGTPLPDRAEQVRRIATKRQALLARLRKAAKPDATGRVLLSPQNRGYLEWQIGDALRPELFALPAPGAGRGRAQGADATADTMSKSAGKSRKPPER